MKLFQNDTIFAKCEPYMFSFVSIEKEIHYRMKSYSIFSILFLFLTGAVMAQTPGSYVSGSVLDTEGQELPFATAILFSAVDSSMAKAGYTEDDGSFKVGPVLAGKYWLKIKFTGQESYVSEVIELAEDENLDLKQINLGAADTEIDEVQIRAEKPLVTVKPDMMVFNVAESPNAIGSNAFDLLRKAPGVVVDNNDNVTLLGKSGVRIYIDGKPSYLSVTDLAAMLKTMQSDQIESIEIITNPSAKFDAEGNAGIINIKMKRDERYGWNGSVNAGFAYGRLPKGTGGLSMNYRNKYFTVFGSYSTGIGGRRNFINLYRLQNNTIFDQQSSTVTNYENHNFRGGADFYLKKNHTLGFMVNGFNSGGVQENKSQTFISEDSTETPISILESYFPETGNDTLNSDKKLNLNFNLNYRFENEKGTSLNLDADFGYFKIRGKSFVPNTYLSSAGDSVLLTSDFGSHAPNDIRIWTGKADYERKLWKGTLSLGAKVAWVTTDNAFDFYRVVGETWSIDTNRSNAFFYRENVNAAYLNYSKKFKKFGFQAGVRMENTNWTGDLTALDSTQNQVRDSSYINFFPSAGVTYDLNRNNVFSLTYSRRIDRPSYQSLNPFRFQLDELTYQQGNPFLQPQFTHNVQLSHTYKYTLNTTLSYSYTSGFNTELVFPIDSIRSFLTNVNIDWRQTVNLNVSYPFTITKWWSTYTNIGGRYMKIKGDQITFEDLKPADIEIDRWTYNIYHQSTFQLPWDISIQLSGFYNSPGIWGANSLTAQFWGIDAGVVKKFMKGRGTFKISVTDIFFTQQWRGIQELHDPTDAEYLYMDASGGWESRQIKANLSISFGNQKVKARKRKTGLEDEKGRVK